MNYNVFQKLRDLGVFFIGVSCLTSCFFAIYHITYSSENKMKNAILDSMTEAFKKQSVENK